MKKGKNSLFSFFLSMFEIGCIGFGGGNALIPVLYRKTVEENGFVSDEEFDEDVMIASITPGALPVEIAGGIGHRLSGWRGTLVGSFGMALPGIIATVVLLYLFAYFSEIATTQIRYVTLGVSAYICVLLSEYVKGTFVRETNKSDVRKYFLVVITVFLLICEKNLYKFLEINSAPIFALAIVDIFLVSFFLMFCNSGEPSIVLTYLSIIVSVLYIFIKGQKFNILSRIPVNIIYIIMGTMSVVSLSRTKKKAKIQINAGAVRSRVNDIFALGLIMFLFAGISIIINPHMVEFIGNGLVSSLISFGGGDAYLTVADGLFVETGILDENLFYGNVVPVVNVLPGSILCKTLSGIGFCLGHSNSILSGIFIAMAGASVSIFASCGIFSLIHAFYSSLSEIPAVIAIKKWIRPIVSGCMISVMLSLMNQSKRIADGWQNWLYVLMFVAIYIIGMILNRKGAKNIWIIVISIALATVLGNIVRLV